ncbi:MAG: dicarboxylate/amino acid:cation symporter [Firmicutes bacterium]|nr:dicarboxylate/amino acid:cation symporter [Bacillota bacterium]MCL5039461.1 dicarboxylate/amino acid:cation symporter [Bacillota bacterium]
MKSLTNRILLGLVLGVVAGIVLTGLPASAVKTLNDWILGPVGDAFIRLIKLLVAPLVLTSLVVGTASLGDIRKVGRLGGQILGFYLATTALAVVLGLIIAGIFNPGLGLQLPTGTSFKAPPIPSVASVFLNMIPTNPFEALVKADMLQIIVFALLTGSAMTAIGDKARPVAAVFESFNDVLLRMIGMIMAVAPYGVFALIAKVVTQYGLGILLPLAKVIIAVVLAVVLHAIIVYASIVRIWGHMNPLKFFQGAAPAMSVAFSTCSSAATLPVTMDCSEKNLGVPGYIGSFTLPLGATINMDGTAIYQGISAIFVAQIFGVSLGLPQYLMIILTATVASIGAAGVPGAGLIMLSMVLASVGLPIEGIGLIAGIDRILDMFRTTINVTGDMACTVAVAALEGELKTAAGLTNAASAD